MSSSRPREQPDVVSTYNTRPRTTVYTTEGTTASDSVDTRVVKDAIRPTEAYLRGGVDTTVDVDEGWFWMRQYDLTAGKTLEPHRPLVVFLVTKKPIKDIPDYTHYSGQIAGVFTCPPELKESFKAHRDIIFIEGKRRLQSIVTSQNPYRATAAKLVKHFSKRSLLLEIGMLIMRRTVIAAPAVLTAVLV